MLKEPPAATDLNISPEKVCYVIVKAREFDAKVEAIEPDPGSNASDDGGGAVLEDYADDPTFQELRDAIRGLNDDEIVDLIAIAWIGRGDSSRDEFEEVRSLANERHRRDSSRYLMGMPALGDYLEEGLAELGCSCSEVDLAHL